MTLPVAPPPITRPSPAAPTPAMNVRRDGSVCTERRRERRTSETATTTRPVARPSRRLDQTASAAAAPQAARHPAAATATRRDRTGPRSDGLPTVPRRTEVTAHTIYINWPVGLR